MYNLFFSSGGDARVHAHLSVSHRSRSQREFRREEWEVTSVSGSEEREQGGGGVTAGRAGRPHAALHHRSVVWSIHSPYRHKPKFNFCRPRTKYDGKLCFYRCPSVNKGVPPGLWSLVLSGDPPARIGVPLARIGVPPG